MQKYVRIVLLTNLILLASVAIADDNKDDSSKLIVGIWEVTSTEGDGPPKGSTIEFTKDNKVKVTGDRNGQKMSLEGTYKIDGKKLALKLSHEGNERSIDLTIDKLDEKTFALTNDTGKAELTRKKKE